MKQFCLLTLLAFTSSLPAAEKDGWVSLFNGQDLSGWVPVNVAPNTFTVRDGLIVSTGIPTGVIRTERQYENFIIELEWRHLKPGGNAGLFIWGDALTAPGVPFARGIEVQILDNGYDAKGKNEWFTTHGDVFPIHGATMTPTGRVATSGRRSFPTEDRSKSSPEWNHYRVVCTNGVVRLSVNGREVTVGTDCSPRNGYICLESEGSECHFRNLRLQELPPSGATPEQTAKADAGFKTLYTGVDLSGWRVGPEHGAHWQAKNWTLVSDGQAPPAAQSLVNERSFTDFELILDYRFADKKVTQPTEVALLLDEFAVPLPADGDEAAAKTRGDKPPGQWNRVVLTAKGGKVVVWINDTLLREHTFPIAGKSGPIGLRHHGNAVQFANLFIRPL